MIDKERYEGYKFIKKGRFPVRGLERENEIMSYGFEKREIFMAREREI